MKQDYDLINFKKHLYHDNHKFRPGGLSVWCNTMPIPVDIFDELFRRSDAFFSLYLDHIFAALLTQTWIEEQISPPFQLGDLPDPKVIQKYKHDLRPAFKLILEKEPNRVYPLLKIARALLGQDEYSLNPYSLIKVLSHKGKKYERIYLAEALKKPIYETYPGVRPNLGKKNFDMFGNVLADELKVYRIGYSDAFAQIFSRMLEFKIACNASNNTIQKQLSRVSDEGKAYTLDQAWLIESTSDGALWEPFFDGQIKTRINEAHPLYRYYEASPKQQRAFQALIQKLSEYEMNAMNDKQLRHMENLRKDISRDLWLAHEMDA